MPARGAEGPPSFTAVADDSVTLRPALDAVARITEEARIHVDGDGIYTRMTDAENVVLVELDLPAANFTSYDVRPGSTGLNVKDLHDAVRQLNKSDPVTLEGSAQDGVVRVIDGRSGDVIDEVSMIDPDNVRKSPDLPSLDWQTDVVVNGQQFGRIIRASKDVSDHITMGVAEAGGVGRGSNRLAFQTNAEGDVDEVIGYPDFEFGDRGAPAEPTGALYSIDKVDDLRLAVDRPASTDVTLTFAGTEFPLLMEFTAGEGPGAEVLFMLAPRIESQDGPVDILERWPVDEAALESVDFIADMKGGTGKQLFNLFTTFADEYRLQASESGLEMRAIDSANVAMYTVKAARDFFDSYFPVDGFPDELLGLSDRAIGSVMRKWRKNDDLELAVDSQSRRLSLKHPIFTARVATIDPSTIRSEPQLPEMDLTGRARADADDFVDIADDVATAAASTGFVMSDRRFYLAALLEEDTRVELVPTTDVEGRVFSVLTSEFLEQTADVIPTGPADEVEVRSGLEHPVVIDAEADNGLLQSLFLIAPRIDSEGDLQAQLQAAFVDEPVDLSWVPERDVGDLEVEAAPGFEREPLSERLREERLSTFPIETRVIINGHTEELEVVDGEDLAVPQDTLDDVIAEVDGSVRLEWIDGGETVADVTFTAEDEFDLELRNVQPSLDLRPDTADGFPMRRLIAEADNWAYISPRPDTPAEGQVLARAADVAEGDEYAVYLGLRPSWPPDADDEERIFRRGFDTIGNAYAALHDHITERTLAELVQDAGGEVTLSDVEVREQLADRIDPLVNWSFNATPGEESRDSEFYGALIGRLNVLPDASFRADISIMKPGTEADGYLVRWKLEKIGHGPGDARPVTVIDQDTVGVADGRHGIAPLVDRVFDALEAIDPIYVRERGDPTLDRSEHDGPGVREGQVAEWTAFYLPAPRAEIASAVRQAGLPLELTDVEGIGPSRADTLGEKGLSDMLDVVALTGTTKSTFIGQALLDVPTKPRTAIYNAAQDIWEQVIWPRRPAFPGEAGAEPSPEPEPAADFETAALRVPDDEVIIEGTDDPDEVRQDVLGDHIVVEEFAFGLGYALAGDQAVMAVRDAVADAVEEAIGPATQFSQGRRIGDVVLTAGPLSSREPVQIRVKERLHERAEEREAAAEPEAAEAEADDQPIEEGWVRKQGGADSTAWTIAGPDEATFTVPQEEAIDDRVREAFTEAELREADDFDKLAEFAIQGDTIRRWERTFEVPAEQDFDLPVTIDVSVTGQAGHREIEFLDVVPDVVLDHYPDEKASDDPRADFIRDVASTVAEAIGPPLDAVPAGTVVGELTVFPGGTWGFKPRDDLPTEAEEPAEDEEPDAAEAFAQEAIAEREEREEEFTLEPPDEVDGWTRETRIDRGDDWLLYAGGPTTLHSDRLDAATQNFIEVALIGTRPKDWVVRHLEAVLDPSREQGNQPFFDVVKSGSAMARFDLRDAALDFAIEWMEANPPEGHFDIHDEVIEPPEEPEEPEAEPDVEEVTPLEAAPIDETEATIEEAEALEDALNRQGERELENRINIARRRTANALRSIVDADADDVTEDDLDDLVTNLTQLQSAIERADRVVDEEPEAKPDVPPDAQEHREFNQRVAEQFGLDLRPGESILFSDLPGIGRATQERIEETTSLSAVWNAKTAFEMRDERDTWDALLEALPDRDARRTLVEAIGEDPDEVLGPDGDGDDEDEQPGETRRVVVERIAGNENYTVQGVVPGSVTTEAITVAVNTLGPADQFDPTNTVGEITFIGDTVIDIDFSAGEELLAGEEPDVEAKPAQAFTAAEVETIIEGATLGLDARAIQFNGGITRVELTPDWDHEAVDPGAPSRQINVDTEDPDLDRVIELAVQRWEEDMAVLDAGHQLALNEARQALGQQFGVHLPQFDVEPPEDFTAQEIEDIVTRAVAGAEVSVRINRAANSLRIGLEPAGEGQVRYQRPPREVQDQPAEAENAILEAIQEWEDAVDFRTVSTERVNDRREAVELEHGIDLPRFGQAGAPGEEPPERADLLEKWLMVKEGFGLTEIDPESLREQPGTALPVEVETELAEMIEGATRAEFETDAITEHGDIGQQVQARRAMEGVKQVEQGLQIHHTDAVHDEVHAVIARMLDAEPENFYDSSDPSDLAGYDRVYEFTLSRKSDDQPWTVPRFQPSDLFEALKPHDGEEIKVVTLAAPLK